jgi:D-alanyl-D-alanine carboxypeptidase
VILLAAEKESAVLNERVSFSKLADDTAGSTAGIKVGESVSVRDCLRGLMLPSPTRATCSDGRGLSEMRAESSAFTC